MAHRPRNPLIPARDGVSPSCVAVPHDKPCPWPTVLDFLSDRLPAVDRAGWTARLHAERYKRDSTDAGQDVSQNIVYLSVAYSNR